VTAADRLSAAVDAALPCTCDLAGDPHCARRYCETVLAAALAKARAEGAKEAQAEIARLRTVLEWAATILTADRDGPGIAWRYMPDELRAALHGDWPAVRAAGVVLPGEEPPPSPPAGKRREEQG